MEPVLLNGVLPQRWRWGRGSPRYRDEMRITPGHFVLQVTETHLKPTSAQKETVQPTGSVSTGWDYAVLTSSPQISVG